MWVEEDELELSAVRWKLWVDSEFTLLSGGALASLDCVETIKVLVSVSCHLAPPFFKKPAT